MRKRNFLLPLGAVMAAMSLAISPAAADPNGPPPFRQLAGVGAETSQGVFNRLSDIIIDGAGTKIIASYDNAGSATIQTKATGCVINRPNQGGAGTNALVTSLQANDGCVQFARVVTNDSAGRPGAGLTYIPFAVDALTYAIRDDSPIPRDLTLGELTNIYNCQVPGYKPLLGTFGAGNRTLFLQRLGLTDSADFVNQPAHSCVKDTVNGQPLLANDGTLLTDPLQLVTYSSAPYLAQVNGVVPDKHGKAVLGSINGIGPAVLNNASAISRDIYNVVPTSQIGTGTTINQVFVGASSRVCANGATITRFGFNLNPNCGSTTIRTP